MMQNNPGNIRENNQGFQGQLADSGNGFAAFDSAANGFRAMLVILHSYISKDGVNTINSIINRYAPPSDNNPTQTYINNVSNWTGIPASHVLDSSFLALDAGNGITGLAKAMVRQEGNVISDSDAAAGFASYQSDYL